MGYAVVGYILMYEEELRGAGQLHPSILHFFLADYEGLCRL